MISMIERLFVRKFGPRFLRFGDGMVQVAHLDANRIARHVAIEVQVEKVPGRAKPSRQRLRTKAGAIQWLYLG